MGKAQAQRENYIPGLDVYFRCRLEWVKTAGSIQRQESTRTMLWASRLGCLGILLSENPKTAKAQNLHRTLRQRVLVASVQAKISVSARNKLANRRRNI